MIQDFASFADSQLKTKKPQVNSFEEFADKKIKLTTGELVKGAWAKAMPFGLPTTETIGHLITAPVGLVGGLVSGAGKLLKDLRPGGEKPSFVSVREAMEKTGQDLTYQPQTPEAQTMSRIALAPLEAVGAGREKLAGIVSKDPEVQAATKIATDIALAVLMGKAGKGTRIKPETIGGKFKPVNITPENMGLETLPKPTMPIQYTGETGKPMTIAEAVRVTPKPRTEVPLAIKPKILAETKPPLEPFDQALVDVLEISPPLRKKQAGIYKQEWAKRFAAGETAAEGLSGKAYLNVTRAAAAGEMPKVRYGSIAENFPPELREVGYKRVTDAAVSLGEKWTMEKGLDKIFDPHGGQVPTTLELELLHKIVAPEVIEQLLRKREAWPKFRDTLYEVANVPRAIMASFDLSFPFRQGIFLGAGHPKEFGTAFAEQIKYFGSENAFRVGMEEITSRPTYRYMLKGPGREHGIAFTEMGKILGLREERFLSPLAEKIPILGHGVRASGRAYTGFRNRFSADVFDSLFTDAEKMGLNPARNPVLLDKMSEFINIASGRGSSKSLGHSAMILNSIFFSPRLMLSRLQLFNPHTYLKLPKPVRLDSVKCLAGFIGAGSTILTLSKLAGADVTLDPRSSDFAKIKIGNTRIDTWGGFQQYVRAAAQLVSGKVVSTQTGKVTELGSKFGSPTRLDIAARSLEYKTTPLISLAMNMLRGKTVFGEKLKLLPTFKDGIMDWESGEILSRFIPMVVQDFEDLARDDPKLTPLSLLGIVGFGLQTYKPRPTKPGSQYFYMK